MKAIAGPLTRVLLGGVPSAAGFEFLIKNNLSTTMGPMRGQASTKRNIYIIVANALDQGNPNASVSFSELATGRSLARDCKSLRQGRSAQQAKCGRCCFLTRPEGLKFYQDVACGAGHHIGQWLLPLPRSRGLLRWPSTPRPVIGNPVDDLLRFSGRRVRWSSLIECDSYPNRDGRRHTVRWRRSERCNARLFGCDPGSSADRVAWRNVCRSVRTTGAVWWSFSTVLNPFPWTSIWRARQYQPQTRHALADHQRALQSRTIHRRGPWRSFEAVEFATLTWVDWFSNRPATRAHRQTSCGLSQGNAATPSWQRQRWPHNLRQSASGRPGRFTSLAPRGPKHLFRAREAARAPPL